MISKLSVFQIFPRFRSRGGSQIFCFSQIQKVHTILGEGGAEIMDFFHFCNIFFEGFPDRLIKILEKRENVG